MNQFADVVLKMNPGTANEIDFNSPVLERYEPSVEITYKRSFVTESGNERFTQPIKRQILRFVLLPTNLNNAKINALRENPVATWQYSTPLYPGQITAGNKTALMRIVSISPATARATGIAGTYYNGIEVTLRAVSADV